MKNSNITLKSEFMEDWRLLRPVLVMIVTIFIIYCLTVITRNIIHMYKDSRQK